jgi:hypothetical protein
MNAVTAADIAAMVAVRFQVPPELGFKVFAPRGQD